MKAFLKAKNIRLVQLMGAFVLAFTINTAKADGFTFDDGGGSNSSNPDSFPVPTGNVKQLFYLQRTPNANTVVYEINTDNNGKLNEDNPVEMHWIRYPEGGMVKPLNYIQRKFAYGVSADLMDDGRYKLTFAAYKKKQLFLALAPRDNKYHVYAQLNGKWAILTKVFIQIDPGGSFWKPNVRYLEMKGFEMGTNKEIVERIQIAK